MAKKPKKKSRFKPTDFRMSVRGRERFEKRDVDASLDALFGPQPKPKQVFLHQGGSFTLPGSKGR